MLNTTSTDMSNSWQATNQAFQARVAETESTKSRLMSHLSRNMEEIYQQENHISQLQHAIQSLGPPLKVAQSRLALRASRPEIEACRDSPHHRSYTSL